MKSHKIQSYVLLLLHIFSFQLPSSAYILPDTYFINCGSDNNINSTRRTFTGT
uniref:Kinase family protein n=1 Tax=Rhizophora mucronata TaxID=61149 RepID=A0A2P2J5B3_RHIMU